MIDKLRNEEGFSQEIDVIKHMIRFVSHTSAACFIDQPLTEEMY